MVSAAFSSDVKGASGLAPRTSHAHPSGSCSRNAGRTSVMGKSAGFPFLVDDDSSSSDDDTDVEEVNLDRDRGSYPKHPSLASGKARKPTTGLSQASSGHGPEPQDLRNEDLRRKENQRVESEKLRKDALMRRRQEAMEGSAGGLGLGDLGAVKEEEQVDVKMEDERDVKMEEEDRVVEDSNGREAEVITLSDSDEEDDVISVASAPSGPSSMAGLLNGENSKASEYGSRPQKGSNELKRPLNTTEEARHQHEALSQEKSNTSTTQAPESTPTENTTASASPSHRFLQNSTFSPPPSKSSALQDVTERIRQERLENAERIWQGTQARAQAEAEKARQREAEARAEDVHRNSVYSGSTPDVLERSERPGLPSGNGRAEVERHEVQEDRAGEVKDYKASSGKHEGGTFPRVADSGINKLETWQKIGNKPQKEDARRESLIEQPVPNKPSIDDLVKQRKERQAALVREAEQKLAAEAAKKAESERQMTAYRNAMSSRPAVSPVYGKQVSSVEADEDRRNGVQTFFERDERKNQAVETEKQEGPVSLNFSAGTDGLKATNVPVEPLQTKRRSANPNAVNPHRSAAQPKSLKTVAEQGGTITRAKPVKPELLQLKPLQKSHAPRIEILPQDIKLFFWRDAGNEWQDIIEDYEEATGKKKGEDALRKRYRQVKEALDGVGASRELLVRVGTGNVEAKRELDAMMPQVAVDAEKRPNVETKAGVKASGKDQLGELTPHDIQLLVSKSKGMIWSQAVRDFAVSTGEKVSESLLRARYKLVKEAIEKSRVDASLLSQVMDGDDTAREKLNRLVHGIWPVPGVETDSKVDRPAKGSSHDLQPGHVSADDIRLVCWKEDGMTGAEMVEALKQTTGRTQHVSTVHKRCARVRRGLEAAGVYTDRDLLDLVASGDREACARLNQTLQSVATPTGTAENPARPTDIATRLRTIDTQQEPSFQVQQLRQSLDSASAYSSSYGSREDQPVSTPPTSPGSIVPQPIIEESRPTTAGKQMNEATFRYYLEEIREERLHEEDAGTDSDEVEEDEFTPEDFCHFIYQVERREIASGEEDDTIDEKDWIIHGEPLTDRIKATAVASKQALIAHDGQLNEAIYAGNNWSLNRQNLNNGVLYTLNSPAGTVQVRVQEYQRSFQEKIRPSESVAWVSRTTYTVMQRQTETARSTNTVSVVGKETDPLFGEDRDITTEKEVLTVRETFKEKVVGDFVYTTPDLANDAAMRHFIAETYHPKTINLTVRDLERADLIREYREKYEGQGEEDIPLFREVVEDEDGNSLEVWVQATQLKGPRNA
ncbi:hypothetical protein KC340_g6571 [Hortaea werneckii]|nr:hypothetical protein KC340_g6571 [Hortaea werneckii]KAI7402844.1 hypothetical protein KC328_g2596 [Hortaea werneckii]